MKLNIEVRAGKVIIEGYVNAVGRDSRLLNGWDDETQKPKSFVEQIAPGTFQRALERGTEVKLLLDHNYDRELGSTFDNLYLHEDAIGLYARAEISDAEIVQLANDKKLRGWSFGFIPLGYLPSEVTAAGIERDIVCDMELLEVSIISEMIPVYSGTSIEARAKHGDKEIEIRSFDTGINWKESQEPKGPEKEDESVIKLRARIKELKGES